MSGQRPLRRRGVRRICKRLIAYDLETTPIREGTPEVVYLTAYGDGFEVSRKLDGLADLRAALESDFLLPELDGCRFVGWNANRFDAYFVALALLDSGFVLKPYLTRSGGLRGLRIESPPGSDPAPGKKSPPAWEFLDGMAMTGLDAAGVSLDRFLDQFAPDYPKGELDLSRERFNPDNPQHRAYAERDSEGLYHAMAAAESILYEVTGQSWRPTIGAVGIRHFRASIPKGVNCWRAPKRCAAAIRHQGMRGGYCVTMGRYYGPIWKYDINQAYAAAMREARLPAGRCIESRLFKLGLPGIWRIEASAPRGNVVPWYWKDDDGKPQQTADRVGPCYLMASEVEQMRAEGWRVQCFGGWYWTDSFDLTEMVDRLEAIRAENGSKSPMGLIAKAVGNCSYGKTSEQLRGETLVFSRERPAKGWFKYRDEEPAMDYVWCKLEDSPPRDYHKPQLAATITAHVRMVVRRAALQAPGAFVYADTDCVAFSQPVALDFDEQRYGAWKVEVEGKDYIVVGKKAYAAVDGTDIKCKGLPTRTLSVTDYREWFEGRPPKRELLQRRAFKSLLSGDMFTTRERVAEIVPNSQRGPP